MCCNVLQCVLHRVVLQCVAVCCMVCKRKGAAVGGECVCQACVCKDPAIKCEVVKLGFLGHYTATHCNMSPPKKERK